LNINGRPSMRGTKQSPTLGGEIAVLRCAALAMTRVQGAPDYHTIQAIFSFIRLKPKFVLDTDIEKCFDHTTKYPLQEPNPRN
jgi:hypothetical protein